MKGSNSDSGLTTKWSNRLLVVGLTAILMAVFFTGCRPKGILSSREMRKVLIDLHKTDALINITGLQYGHDEAQNIYYAQVLEKHGITQAQFDSSIVWYTAHPVFFDKIYPKVQADLKAEHDAFLAQYADELKRQPHLGKPAWLPFYLESVGSSLPPTPLMHNLVNQLFPEVGILG